MLYIFLVAAAATTTAMTTAAVCVYRTMPAVASRAMDVKHRTLGMTRTIMAGNVVVVVMSCWEVPKGIDRVAAARTYHGIASRNV